jgi:nitrogen-specific signal transduction histidine kinase
VTIKKISERDVGGTIKTVFQLSLEGFKSLALLAQTHEGREVNRIISSAEMKWKNSRNQMYRELGESLGNIKLALTLLDDMPIEESYERYWEILQSECDRSVNLLERVPEPQHLVLPKNLRVRRNSIPVRFHLTKKVS